MTTPAKQIKLLKFGGLSCPACKAMDRAQTLERLAGEFPQIEIVKYDVNDQKGETPEGSKFAEHYKLSDEYEVEMLPTLIFEDAATGFELGRVEGAVNFSALKDAAEEAIEEFDYTARKKARNAKRE